MSLLKRLGLASVFALGACASLPQNQEVQSPRKADSLSYEEVPRESPRYLEPHQTTQIDALGRAKDGFFREMVYYGIDYHQPKDTSAEDRDYDVIAVISPIAHPSVIPLISEEDSDLYELFRKGHEGIEVFVREGFAERINPESKYFNPDYRKHLESSIALPSEMYVMSDSLVSAAREEDFRAFLPPEHILNALKNPKLHGSILRALHHAGYDRLDDWRDRKVMRIQGDDPDKYRPELKKVKK